MHRPSAPSPRKRKPDPPPPPRRLGWHGAGAAAAGPVARACRSLGFPDPRLVTAWDEIAGPDLAPLARPLRLRAGRGMGATLTLKVLGGAGPLVQMALPGLKARINAACGHAAVARITLTQTAPTGLGEPPAPAFARPPATPARAPDPAPAPAPELVAGLSSIGDPALRAALETLARNVVSRRRQTAARR